RDVRGESLEDDNAELEYLHGFGGIFPKVETALEGKAVGHELSVTLEPEDAFGEYDADLLRVEPRASFPDVLEIGMQFEGAAGGMRELARILTTLRAAWLETSTYSMCWRASPAVAQVLHSLPRRQSGEETMKGFAAALIASQCLVFTLAARAADIVVAQVAP